MNPDALKTWVNKPWKKRPNQKVMAKELEAIRVLADFELIMLISEINDHGWKVARKTLAMMPKAKKILK